MKKLKKRCLILDHDDTLMDSQVSVHYPIFLETLSMMRPTMKKPSFEEFVTRSNQYGFEAYIRTVYQFTQAEVDAEIAFWRQQVPLKKANIFDAVAAVVSDFVRAGGILVVYSYSDSSMILNDYARFFDFKPHDIIGFDDVVSHQKPARVPLLKIMHKHQLKASDCLLVDDMPLLIHTARRINMDMVAAKWSLSAQFVWKEKHHDIPMCHDALCLRSFLFKD